MGCTPSRGKSLHIAHDPFRTGRTLLPVTQESPGELQSDDGGSERCVGGDTDNATGQKNTLIEEKYPTGEFENVLDASAKLGTKEININVLSQPKDKHEVTQETLEKRVSKKHKKPFKEVKLKKKKEKVIYSVNEKIDFPEPLVKAHQAAYGYLNPSITKYEDILVLLDHATQTQISLQPMVAFMLLRYEEVNKGLEDIVVEGEKMFKKHRDYLAWPCQKSSSSSSNSRKNLTSPTVNDVEPDLLQQLLQYTIQRMRLVDQSVCEIGNTAIEETVDYFSSVSKILEEKLKTKRTYEYRLEQLLSQIETASQRKQGPEDSTLYSEDSGIGVESESLAGSERQCQHRGSCDSTRTIPVLQGSYRGRLLKAASNSSSLSSIDSTCTITEKEPKDRESLLGCGSLDEGKCLVGQDIDKEGQNENKNQTSLNSSTPDVKIPRRLPAKRIENPKNVEMTLKLKDAISRQIQFLPCRASKEKTKQMDSSKNISEQWTEAGDKSFKRPQTATSRPLKQKATVPKQIRSKSADSLGFKAEDPTLTELERTQKVLNQRLERMNKLKCEGKEKKRDVYKPIQQQTQRVSSEAAGKQRSLNKNIVSPINEKKTGKVNVGEQNSVQNEMEGRRKKEKVKDTDKKNATDPVKVTPMPSPPPSPRLSSGACRGRNSVKKLIDTFSQGMEEDKQMPESAKVLGPLKGVRKCGVPIIPGLGTFGTLAFSGNTSLCGQGESQCTKMTDNLDIDSLPPPSLEVLMDNSFENVQAGDIDENVSRRGRSTLPKRTATTQKLRASLQSVTVLPSKRNFHKSSLSMSPIRTIHTDPKGSVKVGHHDSSHETDTESEDAIDKRTRIIVHLRYSSDSETKKLTAEEGQRKISSCQDGVDVTQEGRCANETGPNKVCKDQAPSTPPVSKSRALPSTPLLHRKLPSPPVFKSQPTSITSSSPSVARKLPIPPSTGQRIISVSSAMQHDQNPSLLPGVSYPIKAPSPPASPKVQRWSRENSCENPLKIFSNAQSVFCLTSSTLFEAKPVPPPKVPQAWASSCNSVLPRPWGERCQLPVSARGPQPFIRRSQSDRRPSLSLPSNMPVVSVAETCGSEPTISTHWFEDGSRRENNLTELRSTVRSASHPDLCIVGQSLQRE